MYNVELTTWKILDVGKSNPVKICGDNQSRSEIPANLLVYVLRIAKM